MKKIILLFCFLKTVVPLSAQPDLTWQKCLGGTQYDRATSIRQTNEGGYIAAGYAQSADGNISDNHGLFDYWITKLDNVGSIQWERALGGSSDDWAYDVKQTIDGGYIAVGYTDSNNGDVIFNHGDKDAWVVKLNNAGAIEWQKSLGGSGREEANSIDLTSDGGFIVAGYASSNDGDASGNHGFSDFWIVKLNNIGNIEWQKSLGGTDEENAHSIKLTTDGGYIVAGETQSNDGDVSEHNGNVDSWVVKLNSSGEIEWQNALGGNGLDVATDVVETSDGYLVCGLAGSHNSGDITKNHGFFDYWVLKLSTTGELLWQKTFGGSNADYARSITKTKDGNFVIAGETKSTDGDVEGNTGIQVVWVLKLNDSGDLLWKKPLGGTQGEGCFAIRQTSDEGYILGGYTWSNDGDVSGNHGEADFWIVKLSPESSPTSETPSSRLEVYPNPAQQNIFIEIPSGETLLKLNIINNLGVAFHPKTSMKNDDPSLGEVDVSLIPNGLYLFSVTLNTGKVFCEKIIIQH